MPPKTLKSHSFKATYNSDTGGYNVDHSSEVEDDDTGQSSATNWQQNLKDADELWDSMKDSLSDAAVTQRKDDLQSFAKQYGGKVQGQDGK